MYGSFLFLSTVFCVFIRFIFNDIDYANIYININIISTVIKRKNKTKNAADNNKNKLENENEQTHRKHNKNIHGEK